MSRRLPALTADQVVRSLQRAGFTVHRVEGSHHHLWHAGRPSLRVVVPVLKGDLPIETLRAIVRQAGLTEAEFAGLL